MLVMLVVMTA